MKFFCIADKESSPGFKLAGVETREVSSESEAEEALNAALETEKVGVIVITEKAASLIRERVDRFVYVRQFPLLLEIPSSGQAKSKKSIDEFVREAIGISI
jgi:vacuolar-type H+-ATPase subunit F/Vma7